MYFVNIDALVGVSRAERSLTAKLGAVAKPQADVLDPGTMPLPSCTPAVPTSDISLHASLWKLRKDSLRRKAALPPEPVPSLYFVYAQYFFFHYDIKPVGMCICGLHSL